MLPAAPALLAALLLVAFGAGCGQRPKAAAGAEGASAIRGKVRAPVEIEATLAAGTGRVAVRFDAAATDVRVEVWGVDGLVVASAAIPIAGARFEAGEVAEFDVAYAAAPGSSALAVSVAGDFGGSARATVVSFAVTTPGLDRKTGLSGPSGERPGDVVETDDGDRVKVLSPGE